MTHLEPGRYGTRLYPYLCLVFFSSEHARSFQTRRRGMVAALAERRGMTCGLWLGQSAFLKLPTRHLRP